MNRLISHLFLCVAGTFCFLACNTYTHDKEELIDPWTRERTPVGFRLESQIGAAVITGDWRDDSKGEISVSLVTGGLDMSAVKVVSLDFEYPESEFCPTASIKPGSTIDLSSGSASFVVTAHNGETREYVVTYEPFVDSIEGVYSCTTHCCWVYGGNMASWGGTYLTTMDNKGWCFTNYNHGWEDDNVITIVCTSVDDVTGDTFGIIENNPGPDGKYASFDSKWGNLSHFYRCIPFGTGTYHKHSDTGIVTIKGSYVNADGKTVETEKDCFIWGPGSYGPMAALYADDIDHGTDGYMFNLESGEAGFAFKIPMDTPGIIRKNSTPWDDKDKFNDFPKFFILKTVKK